MEYNSDINVIYDVFGSYTGEFVDLVEDMMDRVECNSEDELSDAVLDAINDGLIYYADEWTVLKHYCTPQDANWETAVSSFTDDLINYAYQTCTFEEEEEEDEEPEEDEE